MSSKTSENLIWTLTNDSDVISTRDVANLLQWIAYWVKAFLHVLIWVVPTSCSILCRLIWLLCHVVVVFVLFIGHCLWIILRNVPKTQHSTATIFVSFCVHTNIYHCILNSQWTLSLDVVITHETSARLKAITSTGPDIRLPTQPNNIQAKERYTMTDDVTFCPDCTSRHCDMPVSGLRSGIYASVRYCTPEARKHV